MAVGRWLGRLARRHSDYRRHVVRTNLEICFPELDDFQRLIGQDLHSTGDAPRLADPSKGDYRLAGASPCVDAGDNGIAGLPFFDFEGDLRGIDGDIRWGDTFLDDKHKDLRCDFLLANPPRSIGEDQTIHIGRRQRRIPPQMVLHGGILRWRRPI